MTYHTMAMLFLILYALVCDHRQQNLWANVEYPTCSFTNILQGHTGCCTHLQFNAKEATGDERTGNDVSMYVCGEMVVALRIGCSASIVFIISTFVFFGVSKC